MQQNDNTPMHKLNLYIGLGHAYRCNDQCQTAVEYFEKAKREIVEEGGIKYQEIEVLLGLADACM